MRKILNPGFVFYGGRRADVFLEVKYDNGRLSITGVEGPKKNGDAIGSCGQISETLLKLSGYSEGWDKSLANTMYILWDRWHLNDMRAGSPDQESFLRDHKELYDNLVKGVYGTSWYDWAVDILTKNGLHPDPKTGYRYGSAWLFEPVPDYVLAFLEMLPESKLTPAWV